MVEVPYDSVVTLDFTGTSQLVAVSVSLTVMDNMVTETIVPIMMQRLFASSSKIGGLLPIITLVFGFCFVLKVKPTIREDERKETAMTSRLLGKRVPETQYAGSTVVPVKEDYEELEEEQDSEQETDGQRRSGRCSVL